MFRSAGTNTRQKSMDRIRQSGRCRQARGLDCGLYILHLDQHPLKLCCFSHGYLLGKVFWYLPVSIGTPTILFSFSATVSPVRSKSAHR